MKKTRIKLALAMAFLLVVPTLTLAQPALILDMDASTPEIESEIWLLPDDSFTTNILIALDVSESLSSFGFSVMWDGAEVTPQLFATSEFDAGWLDSGCDPDNTLQNCAQFTIDSTTGPYESTVLTIDWLAQNPVTDNAADIQLGFFSALDNAFDAAGDPVTFDLAMAEGKVHLAPEPISSILFLTGGATLGLRRFIKRRK